MKITQNTHKKISYNTQITTYSVAETQQLGHILGATLEPSNILALNGELGSGKTAFVQGLAKGLEVSDKYYITSPTFTLINEYPGRSPLFHVDLYRIEHISELEEIGLEEVLCQHAIVAIEWADKLPEGRLPPHLALHFKIISEKSRQIDIFAYGHAQSNLLKAVEKRIHQELKGK